MKASRSIIAASILALTAFGAQAAISERLNTDDLYIASIVEDGAYVAGVVENGLTVASTDRSAMFIA